MGIKIEKDKVSGKYKFSDMQSMDLLIISDALLRCNRDIILNEADQERLEELLVKLREAGF